VNHLINIVLLKIKFSTHFLKLDQTISPHFEMILPLCYLKINLCDFILDGQSDSPTKISYR
jgi:hypothetical protein